MRILLKKINSGYCGWGNGYVIMPKGHKLHGVDYNDINVEVHGGLTYSELITKQMLEEAGGLTSDDLGCWIIGFDTCHAGDNKNNCTRDYVESEARNLMRQVMEYK